MDTERSCILPLFDQTLANVGAFYAQELFFLVENIMVPGSWLNGLI